MSGSVSATTAAIVSAATTAYSMYAQGEAQKEQADYQAKVNDVNAEIARRESKDAQDEAARVYAKKMDERRMLMATQRAKSGGLQADTGTFGKLQDETATLAGLDALQLLNNGQRSAYALNVDAMNSDLNAAGNRLAGSNAQTAGYIGAAGSLLSGAANVASMSYKFNSSTPASNKMTALQLAQSRTS